MDNTTAMQDARLNEWDYLGRSGCHHCGAKLNSPGQELTRGSSVVRHLQCTNLLLDLRAYTWGPELPR